MVMVRKVGRWRKLCKNIERTEGSYGEHFAEHPVSEGVLADHLELVRCSGVELVHGDLRTARRSYGNCRPVGLAGFSEPTSENEVQNAGHIIHLYISTYLHPVIHFHLLVVFRLVGTYGTLQGA